MLLTNDEATSHNTILRLLCLPDIKNRLKIDLDMLLDILGDSFFSMKNYISVEKTLVEKIESLTVNLVSNKNVSGEVLPLIYVCQQLSKVDFKQLILCHRSSIQGLAQRFDKSIKPLIVKGESVFVSEKNINKFNRVLVHIFRNAICHGIETKEQRERTNKGDLAKIICHVSSNDNYLQLEISDDGQGINLDKIVEKSITLNLISKEEVAATCKNKLIQFIFSDQLSTTQSINQLSGRGMGLSAVKAEVEALGGIVTVYSEKNVGTRFMFSIPLEKVR